MKISKVQQIAMYLKNQKDLRTNDLVQYCWDNNLTSEEIQFVKNYVNGTILYTL